MKNIFTLLSLALSLTAFSQSPSIGIPDSVKNLPFAGSTGQYTISNPLVHGTSSFTNPPTTLTCFVNCKSDYLYFYDLNLNVPTGATITGVKVIHSRGGCNVGGSVIDTLHLAYNGAIISSVKRDSTSIGTDTLGSAVDNWSAALTPAIVNSNSFGLFINSSGTGVCTFAQFDIQVKVYYTICVTSNTAGIPDSVKNLPFTGSTGQYTISNPLVHGTSSFTNPPTTLTCFVNCKSDYLYFYDLNLNVPTGATITGVKVIHSRGGCNVGGSVIDTLHLAYNGAIISSVKRDSTSIGTDTLGSAVDNWSAALTPAIVNSNSFGLFINSSGTGVCTFAQFDIQVEVYFCTSLVGINNIIKESTIKVFPNPVSESLTLKVEKENINNIFSIFDYTGKLITSEKIVSESTQINTNSLSGGMYFIKIDGDLPQTIKFIKK